LGVDRIRRNRDMELGDLRPKALDETGVGSLSEITLIGSPNHRYTCSRYNCATPSPVIVVEQGRNTAALEHP
jgi:hypothetical protein